MEYYTYVWRDAAGVPFYVGKGRGDRASKVGGRSDEFIEVYSSGGCYVEIVDSFIHESQAHEHEVKLISLYGRREFGGLLVNKTDGGEGASGYIPTIKHRSNISVATVGEKNHFFGKNHTEETRSKMSSWQREKKLTPDQILGLSTRMEGNKIRSGKSHTTESREKISRARLGKKAGAGARAKMCVANRMRPPKKGYKGVSFCAANGKWSSSIYYDGKSRFQGYFSAAEGAAAAYDSAAVEAFGLGNSYLNLPEIRGIRQDAP